MKPTRMYLMKITDEPYIQDVYFANETAMAEYLSVFAPILGGVGDRKVECHKGIVYIDGIKFFKYKDVEVHIFE